MSYFATEHDDKERSCDWKNLAVNVHEGISNLWQEGFGTDFEIVAGGKSFRCHKVVIAAVSDYFKAMFNSGMKETEQDKVVFEDISSASFDTIFKILYPKYPVEEQNHPLRNESEADILELVTLASRFQMQFLKKLSLDFLQTTLSCDNCVNRWKFGDEIQCEELAWMGRDFVGYNFEALVSLRALDSLGYDDFLNIIGDNSMNVSNEEITWRAIRNWINFNEQDRSQYISTLIKECCLTEIQTEILSEEIAFDSLVRYNDEASIIVQEALRYNRHPSIHGNLDLKFRDCHDKDQVTVLLYDQYDDQVPNDTPKQLKVKLVCSDNEVWTLKTNNSIVRHAKGYWNISCCVHGQSIFVLKGSCRNEAQLSRYDINRNKWHTKRSIGKALAGHTMCALDKCLYVSGGRSGTHMNEHVWKYDIDRDSWSECGEIIAPVVLASSVAYEKKIYIIGGTIESREPVDCVQVYDTITETGTIFCKLPKPCSSSQAILRRSTVYIVTSDGDVEKVSLDTAETAVIASVSLKDKVSYGINMRSDEITVYTGSRRKLTADKQMSSSSQLSIKEDIVLNDVDDFVINVKTGDVEATSNVLHRCGIVGCVSVVVNLNDKFRT